MRSAKGKEKWHKLEEAWPGDRCLVTWVTECEEEMRNLHIKKNKNGAYLVLGPY